MVELANPSGPRHSLAPAAAEQEQPQHALSRSGNGELKDSWAGGVVTHHVIDVPHNNNNNNNDDEMQKR